MAYVDKMLREERKKLDKDREKALVVVGQAEMRLESALAGLAAIDERIAEITVARDAIAKIPVAGRGQIVAGKTPGDAQVP